MRDAGIVLFMIGALAAVPARAGEEGKVAADTPWSQSDGGFGATLELDRAEEVVAMPGLGKGETVRGKPIFASVTFEGCATNDRGSCDVVARFMTKTPDGKPLGEPMQADYEELKLPGKAHLQMLKGKIGIVIQPVEVLGVYQVKVEVLDRVAKKQVVLEREFKAVDAPAKS